MGLGAASALTEPPNWETRDDIPDEIGRFDAADLEEFGEIGAGIMNLDGLGGGISNLDGREGLFAPMLPHIFALGEPVPNLASDPGVVGCTGGTIIRTMTLRPHLAPRATPMSFPCVPV